MKKNKEQEQLERDFLLRSFLFGHYGSDFPASLLTSLHVNSTASYYIAVCHILVISNLNLGGESRPDTSTLISVLFRSTFEKLSYPYISIASHGDLHCQTVIFCSELSPEDTKERVIKVCKDAMDILSQSYGISAQTMVSGCVSGIVALPTAFQETEQLYRLANAIDSDSTLVIKENMFGKKGTLLSGGFFKQIQILTNTLLTGNLESVPAMVDSILDKYVSQSCTEQDMAYYRLQTVVNLLTEGLITAKIPGLNLETAVAQLRVAESASALKVTTRALFQEAATLAAANTKEERAVQIALDNIHANLNDPNLGATIICAHTGVEMKRLTRMFQRKYDMTVVEYINRCRISSAKELLKNPKLTVAQIATQVGYISSDTLARNFRKFEGITPTEFRKML